MIISGCSILTHNQTVAVSVSTDNDPALVRVKNSNYCLTTPVTIDLLRARENIILTIEKDSITREYSLKSTLSFAFWVGNTFSGLGIIGHAIDLTSPKRFTYPKNNYFALLDNKHKKWSPPVKNQLSMKISIPESNHFYIHKRDGYGNSFGFMGISAGLEYYVSDKYSFNLDIGTMTDFLLPFPAPIDYDGGYDRSFASYLDFQIGKDFGAFHFDIGVQGNRTSYYERETISLFPVYIDILKYHHRQYNAGLAASGYYRINKGFNLGFNYYPSVFTWNNGYFDVHYAHLLMFELLFKIKLYKPSGGIFKGAPR
jgi:hypothetical protein